MFGHLTYLVFELVWALPVVAIHWVLDAGRLIERLRVIAIATLVPTAYLTLADAVAIHEGIWTLHGSRILGIRIGNVPIEETVFFLVTNVLVVQSVILLAPKDATGGRAEPQSPFQSARAMERTGDSHS